MPISISCDVTTEHVWFENTEDPHWTILLCHVNVWNVWVFCTVLYVHGKSYSGILNIKFGSLSAKQVVLEEHVASVFRIRQPRRLYHLTWHYSPGKLEPLISFCSIPCHVWIVMETIGFACLWVWGNSSHFLQ